MYIVFERIVGTGKTTQSKKLADWLKIKFPKRKITWTREPGGTEIADNIRKTVQGTPYNEKMDVICEAYLYAASRAQSLRSVVKPSLKSKNVVIADRSFITSLVYQGQVRGAGMDKIWKINSLAVENVIPDIVFFLDLDISTALSRVHDHDGDKWEKLGKGFFIKARKGYKDVSQLRMLRGRWANIDARGTTEEVFTRIQNVLVPLLKNSHLTTAK